MTCEQYRYVKMGKRPWPLRERPLRILKSIMLNEGKQLNTVASIRKGEVDAVNTLEKLGLVMTKHTGRIRLIRLTDDGREITVDLIRLDRKLRRIYRKSEMQPCPLPRKRI